MKPLNTNRMELNLDVSGHTHATVRPGLVATFYLNGYSAPVCAAIADAIEIYFSVVPRTQMKSYLGSNGWYKEINSRVITKDINSLRKLPSGYDGYIFNYSSEPYGQVGSYGVYVRAMEVSDIWPKRASLLRLEFPLEIVETIGEDAFVNLIQQVAAVLPIHCGTAGLAFKRASAMEDESIQFIGVLLKRYLGFDPCEFLFAYTILNHTYSAHWLNILSSDLMTTLGGPDQLNKTSPNAHLWSNKNCYVIRASRLPPAGDVHTGAKDLGTIPSIARFLQPRRLTEFRRMWDNLAISPDQWFARFDDLQDTDWDNS